MAALFGHGAMSGLRSGQVAGAAGVSPETLRYYERRGLLDEPERTLGGHRLYPATTVTRLRFIKSAQRLGFSLEEIVPLLRSCMDREEPRPNAALRAHGGHKLEEIERRIAELSAISDTLRFAVAGGCDDPVAYLGSPRFRLVAEPIVRPSTARTRRVPHARAPPPTRPAS